MRQRVEINYELPETVKAPAQQGEVIGKAILSKQGNVIKEIEIIINENLEKLTLKDCLDRIVEKF